MGIFNPNFMDSPYTQLGIGLLAGGGPSLQPVGFGQAASQAMLQMQIMQAQKQRADMERFRFEQEKKEAERKLEKERKAEEALSKLPGLRKQYETPAVPPQQTYLMGEAANMAGTDQFTLPGRPAQFDRQGYQDALTGIAAGINPQGTLSAILEKELKGVEPKDLMKLGIEDSVWDPNTRQFVHKGAGKPQYKERTNVKKIGGVDHYIKEASMDGGMSWSPISDPYPVKSTVANITQNVGGPALEQAEHKSKGEYNVKNLYTEAAQQAVAARKQNIQLDSMSRTVGSSGWVQSVVAPAANALTSLGLASDKAKVIAKDAQTFNAAAMELVLQKQLAQKGPQTESDAMRLQQSLPKFSNVVEANKYLIDFARVQNNRDIEFQRYLDKYWAANRTYEGAEEAWYSGPGATSLFDDPIMKKWDSKPTSGTKSIQEQAADILKGK